MPTPSRLKSLAPWASALLLVVVALVAGRALDRHTAEIEAWIADLGTWGVVVFLAFFVATTSAFFPESILAIMAGALFGFRSGLAIVLAGNLIAAPLQYALSRWVFHTRIARVLAGRARFAEVAGRRNELGVQLLLRLAPLNPATVSYVLGAAGTRFPSFLLACVALVPHLAAEVYLGYAGKHLVHVAGRETPSLSLHDLTFVAGFVAAVAVIPFLSRLVRRALGGSAPGVGSGRVAK